MKHYLGIDIGSVSINIVVIDENAELIFRKYLRSQGAPVAVIRKALLEIDEDKSLNFNIDGVATTGSGRKLIGKIIGADEIKNEITAHATGCLHFYPNAGTILEIGGQDSKMIIMDNGIVVDFAMNTVCAAGTGSFLDQQAGRLGISIEEFSKLSESSENPTKIAGRCGVFAESDMIHKQQMGFSLTDITAGLCEALVRNYMNNVGRGKELREDIIFQGGVAANLGIRKSFKKILGLNIIIPQHYDIIGAIGSALIARNTRNKRETTNFRGFSNLVSEYETRSFECDKCANSCEIIEILKDGKRDFCMGGKCGRFS